MRQERIAAATMVAKNLFEAEEAIDIAIAKIGSLQSSIPTARLQAKLSGVMGQDAMRGTSECLSSLVQARGRIIDVHGNLDDLKSEMGLRTLAMGGGMLKPIGAEDANPETRAHVLRVA